MQASLTISRRAILRNIRSIMTQEPRRLYSAAAGSGNIPKPDPRTNNNNHQHQNGTHQDQRSTTQTSQDQPRHQPQKRAPSPSHIPKTSSPEESVYVLTLLTDKKHHDTLTATRNQYFPPRINRLEAHITLFHALPGSELDSSIKPTLRRISEETTPFHILAAKPFRLNKGVAIGMPKSQGGDDAREVHARLKAEWRGFLSQQDAGGFAAHYTIMNKVDDQKEVQKAFEEVEGRWKGCHGTVLGLSLFRYDRGRWVHEEDFRFAAE